MGWQDRLWARWTPLAGQERDDLNSVALLLRTRCLGDIYNTWAPGAAKMSSAMLEFPKYVNLEVEEGRGAANVVMNGRAVR